MRSTVHDAEHEKLPPTFDFATLSRRLELTRFTLPTPFGENPASPPPRMNLVTRSAANYAHLVTPSAHNYVSPAGDASENARGI